MASTAVAGDVLGLGGGVAAGRGLEKLSLKPGAG